MSIVLIDKVYKPRPIRFLELYKQEDWIIKVYSISDRNEIVDAKYVEEAKHNFSLWLQNTNNYPLSTYQLATLILHECKEGCFAIISWWIDNNMLQLLVYLTGNSEKVEYKLFSDKGIVSCVWELEIIWFERNAWVQYVLCDNPDFNKYLHQQLNKD